MAVLKMTGVALVIILALFGVVLYLATTPTGEVIIRKHLERRLTEMLGQQISIASFETNIVSRIQLQGVVLPMEDSGNKQPFLSVGYARADYRLWRVLSDGFSLDSVRVDSMAVSVLRDSTGFHIPRPHGGEKRESPGQPLDFRLYFSHLDIHNSSLVYNDRIIPLRISARAFDANLWREQGDTYRFRLGTGFWNAGYRERSVSVDSLSISGSMTGDSVTVNKFDITFPQLRCTASGTVSLNESPVSFNGQARIQGNLQSVATIFVDTIPSWLYPQTGGLDMVVGVTGNAVNPSIAVSAAVSDVKLRDTMIRSASLEGTYKNRMLALQRMNFDLLDGHINGTGSVAVDSLLIHDFSMTLTGIRLDRLWETVYKDSSPYKGVLNGNLTTSGPLKDPRNLMATAHLSMESVTYRSQPLTDFKTELTYEYGQFNLGFIQSQTELTAAVSLDGEAVQGKFRFHTEKPGGIAGFVKIFELYGSLEVNGTISGNIRNPTVTADFEGENIRFHGFPLDVLHGGVRYENGEVVLNESAFSGYLASVDSLTQPFHVPDLHGAVNYSGNIRGPADNPVGRIELHFDKPEYRTYNLDSATMLLSVDNKKATVEHSMFVKGSHTLEMTGVYSIPSRDGSLSLAFSGQAPDSTQYNDTRFDRTKVIETAGSRIQSFGTMDLDFSFANQDSLMIDASGNALNLGRIASLYSDSIDVDGILSFNLHFEGSPGQPSGTLKCAIIKPLFRQVTMDSLYTSLLIKPDMVRVETLEMYLNNQRTRALAEIGLKRSGKSYPVITGESAVYCSAEGRNVTIQLLKLILPAGMSLTGGSSYSLECHGLVGKPVIRGNFALHDAELRIKPNAPPIQALNITTALQDTVLVIERAEGIVSTIPFLLTGSVTTTDWQRFRTDGNVRVSGNRVFDGSGTFTNDSFDCNVRVTDFDVALLRAFTTAFPNLGGKANAVLSLTGQFENPELVGSLRLSDITFKVPFFDIPVTRGSAAATFDHDTIRLDSLTAVLDKGKIHASGTAVYSRDGVSQLALNANLSAITFKRSKDFLLVIDSARLSCTKHDSYYDLDGEINLGESRLLRDFQPTSLIPFMQRVERPTPSPSQTMQHMRMNIMIKGGQKLWVDNNLARLRISSNVGVIGTLASPNLTGRLSVEEGYILYLDKKFRIDHGILDFIDPNRVNPLVDFSAMTTLKSYQTLSKKPYDITLTVTGPLDRTVFELKSAPPLDRSDIVALLTVGATREQLTGKTSGGADVSLSEILKQRAEVLSSQKISGYVSGKVGNLLGLEEFSIEGNLFNMRKSSGPQLIASERFSDRMDITYKTAVGHLNEQKISLNYRLDKFFSIEGETDQKGRAGIDLKYQLRFK